MHHDVPELYQLLERFLVRSCASPIIPPPSEPARRRRPPTKTPCLPTRVTTMASVGPRLKIQYVVRRKDPMLEGQSTLRAYTVVCRSPLCAGGPRPPRL